MRLHQLEEGNPDANPAIANHYSLDDDRCGTSGSGRMVGDWCGFDCPGSDRLYNEPLSGAKRHRANDPVHPSDHRGVLAALLAEARGSAMARKLRLPPILPGKPRAAFDKHPLLELDSWADGSDGKQRMKAALDRLLKSDPLPNGRGLQQRISEVLDRFRRADGTVVIESNL